jgi:tRNA-specific 2-thiouridylase
MVGLSGGVDSAAAAALLLEDGWQVAGVYMITCDAMAEKVSEAQQVADRLNIKLDVIDLRNEFETIIDYFAEQYTKGRTPNPCVMCNRLIKFDLLVKYAEKNGFDHYATGHYAQIIQTPEGPGLFESQSTKDQSYVLSMVKREVFAKVILPLGNLEKEQIRQIAKRWSIEIHPGRESQEICFIPDDNYPALLEKRHPDLARPGQIVDSAGNLLGQHMGIHNYTIGQRRGLGIAMGIPWYVVKIDAENNRVVLGPKEEVMSQQLIAANVNWLTDPITEEFDAKVKIRYNHKGAPAKVKITDNKMQITFQKKINAPTPGQLAVCYINTPKAPQATAAAWIQSVIK